MPRSLNYGLGYDITYAVHDLEDFYRADMISLGRLSKSS